MVTATGSVPSVGVRCGDPYGLLYQSLRAGVLARGGGRCAFCGLASAVEAHHSGLVYPCGSDRSCCGRAKVAGGDLVGLCRVCHRLVTTLRRFCRAGGDVYVFEARCREVIASCGIGSFLGVLAPSSVVTERPDWTPGRLPTSRRRRSPERKRRTGPRSTTSGELAMR